MIQNLFKKSAAFKIGIPRNGFNKRRSLSPVIIQDALAETTNSRNLLSLGSRQSVIVSDVSMKMASSLNCFKANNFSSVEIYLPDFERNKTPRNSFYVLRLEQTFPLLTAVSKHLLGLEYLNKKELINVLVSITNKLFFIQQLFKDFLCKTIFYRFITDFIEQGKNSSSFVPRERIAIWFSIFFSSLSFILGETVCHFLAVASSTSIMILSMIINFVAYQIYEN